MAKIQKQLEIKIPNDNGDFGSTTIDVNPLNSCPIAISQSGLPDTFFYDEPELSQLINALTEAKQFIINNRKDD